MPTPLWEDYMKRSNYKIVSQTSDMIELVDLGPWNQYLTITNDAENVIADLAPILNGRRVFYEDSEGEVTELLHNNGVFTGFR